MEALKTIVEAAWDDRSLLTETTTIEAIEAVVEALDKGKLRVQSLKTGYSGDCPALLCQVIKMIFNFIDKALGCHIFMYHYHGGRQLSLTLTGTN